MMPSPAAPTRVVTTPRRRAVLRHRERTGSSVPVRLLWSSRAPDDVIYQAELDQPAP
jgi:hypothetical protein